MKKYNKHIVFILSVFFLIFYSNLFANERGMKVSVETSTGKTIELYHNSYALIVGNGNYTNGWDPLPGAIKDVKEISDALKRNGFKVKLRTNLTKDGFNREFAKFVYKHGNDINNRLLFYYAGHGYTRPMATGEELGYLVMVNAPAPEKDLVGFITNSMDMQSMLTQAKMINAKHVLFMFDSCFSGTVLNLRERVTPSFISDNVKLPVRQFITAGRANQSVPDYSVFKQCFLDILEGRDAEPIKDGYLTGEELGLYLKNKVPSYNKNQHPQYGKIKDPKLDKGDFVFLLGSSGVIVEKSVKGKATLSIKSNVSGAKVLVDGHYMGSTNLSGIKMSPGQHGVRVEKDGYKPYSKRVFFKAGRSMLLNVFLGPKTPPKSTLYVDTHPKDARIRILNIGPKFYQGMELNAGRYLVEVSANGYETQKTWVSLSAGQDKTLDFHLKLIVIDQPVTHQGQKISNNLGMEFVHIPPGTFTMGSPSNEPGRDNDEKQHQVTLTQGFYMQTTEVTVGQWRAFVRDTKYRTEAEKGGNAWILTGNKWSKKKGLYWNNLGFPQTENNPVTCVSWNDVQSYIKWLNRKQGNKYRLPTESEWEYACRAGSTTAFANGGISELKCGQDTHLNVMGWYCGNSNRKTQPVSGKKPNYWGLYDTHGNVAEWCRDWYGTYTSDPVKDPNGPNSGTDRVMRGGHYFSESHSCRSAARFSFIPNFSSSAIGFRLVMRP